MLYKFKKIDKFLEIVVFMLLLLNTSLNILKIPKDKYIVIEGISDSSNHNSYDSVEKNKIITYTGGLNERISNIDYLIKSFFKT